jgi:hypothetical protein
VAVTRDLRAFAPTLCRVLGVTPPALARAAPLAELDGRARRALIYCPDAMGLHALERWPALHGRLRAVATHEVELRAMPPPKTPVCFASLFTGASPEEHGIRRYERPVLTCDTVFDALARAAKRVAIVAVRDSSIDLIFRDRPVDYHSMEYDPLVTARVLELLGAREHDVIVAYHQEYDDLMHRTGPFSPLAARAAEHAVETWELLAAETAATWASDYLLTFCPDHGAHAVPETGRGDHGEDRPEDMRVAHFFALR